MSKTFAAGNVSEIFYSIQGEGIYAGQPQTFLRLAGCNIACSYCDTSYARKTPSTFKYEKTPGKQDFMTRSNPITSQDLMELLWPYLGETLWISLTGGEPLLQDEFLLHFLPLAKEKNAKIYLETNGTLFKQLETIKDFVDVIAMDIKLPSSSGLSFDEDVWAKFINIAKTSNAELFVKVVVCGLTTKEEISTVSKIIARADVSIPLVIQPVTPVNGISVPDEEQTAYFTKLAKNDLNNVSVIPQTHKLLGVP